MGRNFADVTKPSGGRLPDPPPPHLIFAPLQSIRRNVKSMKENNAISACRMDRQTYPGL